MEHTLHLLQYYWRRGLMSAGRTRQVIDVDGVGLELERGATAQRRKPGQGICRESRLQAPRYGGCRVDGPDHLETGGSRGEEWAKGHSGREDWAEQEANNVTRDDASKAPRYDGRHARGEPREPITQHGNHRCGLSQTALQGSKPTRPVIDAMDGCPDGGDAGDKRRGTAVYALASKENVTGIQVSREIELVSATSFGLNMSIRGERFAIDFSDEEDDGRLDDATGRTPRANPTSFSFVGDIVERDSSAAKPPSLPTVKGTTSGFPEHKKRTKISAFKQQRTQGLRTDPDTGDAASTSLQEAAPQTNPNPLTRTDRSFADTEILQIHQENNQRLAAMSEDQIDEERQELLSSLSPALIEKLMRRANMDQGRGDTGIDPPFVENTQTSEVSPATKVDDDAVPIPMSSGKRLTAARTVTFDDDQEPADPGVLQPPSTFKRQPIEFENGAVHFPSAPTAPELDPSDPSFLENLHTKYFPSLPADPSKLAWMAPVPTHGSPADQDSPYYPAQEALPASALRFDFRGGLLPPRIARAMPTNKGLHHHGEAPEAAGYTVPELARLSRSAFPAQRCIAFQTLGRLLYRLGRGDLGDEGSEIAKGLWRCIEEGKVIETLEQAANAEGGHQGSKTYAVEAVWLWQKGGGQKWKAS